MKKFIVLIITGLLTITSLVMFIMFYNNPNIEIIWMSVSYYSFITSILLLFITSVLTVWLHYRNKNEILEKRLERWSEIAPRISQVGEDTFNELPVGILVLDEFASEIKWVNSYARQIFKQEVTEKLIDEVSVDLHSIIKDGGRNKKIIEVEDEFYEVIYKPTLQAMYLFNATQYKQVLSLYMDNIPALGFLSLDNFEEGMQKFDLTDQSSIKGRYLSEITDWADNFEAYLKPITDDRFIIISYRKQLYKMMEEQFPILDTIRNISFENKIAVSISMGIVSWEVDYNELSGLAQKAIELAEKRGGDQVVVNIENEQIKYFGAKTDALVKQSRVSARVNAKTLHTYFENAKRVFVMGHIRADLDSLGAMIAIVKMVQSSSENTNNNYLVIDYDKLDDTSKEVIEFLEKMEHPILERVVSTEEALEIYEENDILVIVDTQQQSIVHSPELLQTDMEKIVIDHHRSHENTITASFSYTDPAASSTVEILVELISFYEEKVEFDSYEASIMYGGLLVDTDNFTFRTSAKTFETAATLKDFGADIVLVKNFLKNDRTNLTKMNDLVNKADIIFDNFAIAMSDELSPDPSFLAKISQTLLTIKGIDAAFTIANLRKGVVGISARSLGKINVQLIMEALGGGGHLTSAATQIKTDDILGVKQQLIDILNYQKDEGDDEVVKVILLEDVKGRGKKDQVVDLPNGYANFLINSKKAVLANDENIKNLKERQAKEKEDLANELALLKKLSDEINGKSIDLTLLVGKDGRRFGSITTKHVVEKFQEEHDILIDRKKIDKFPDINSAGIYPIVVDLGRGVNAKFEVNVLEESRS